MDDRDNETVNEQYLGDLWRDPESIADFEPSIDERPWLFLSAGGVIILAISALWAVILYLVWPRLGQFFPLLPVILTSISAFVFLYIMSEYIAILLTVSLKKPLLLPLGRKLRAVVKISPIALRIAGIFGKTRDRMAHSFVEAYNAIVLSYTGKTEAPVLILLPRCIQRQTCKRNIVDDIDDCARCGQCPVAELLELRDEYGNVSMAVLTGGSVAASIIRRVKPGVVVGIACEREVWLGIELVEEIPVLGICNTRPEGPCIHTKVDIEEVRTVLNHFAELKKPVKEYA